VSGTIRAVGEQVTGFRVGQPVADRRQRRQDRLRQEPRL
jgi:NADPH:quinone reductase-like Zn-dependent oxidoreductase